MTHEGPNAIDTITRQGIRVQWGCLGRGQAHPRQDNDNNVTIETFVEGEHEHVAGCMAWASAMHS